MPDQQIAEVESQKHLGIWLLNDFTWHIHIEYISKKPTEQDKNNAETQVWIRLAISETCFKASFDLFWN